MVGFGLLFFIVGELGMRILKRRRAST
jgi:hypothetical protein